MLCIGDRAPCAPFVISIFGVEGEASATDSAVVGVVGVPLQVPTSEIYRPSFPGNRSVVAAVPPPKSPTLVQDEWGSRYRH